MGDIQYARIVYRGTHISHLLRHTGKSRETVELCQQIGVDLYLRDKLPHVLNQFIKQSRFQLQDALVGSQNLLLILLQFLRDVSLRLSQCLLANPVLWHLVLKRIAHLQIVPEDIVVPHFERGDARLLYLTLLYLHEIALAVVRYAAQVVQFGIVAGRYHTALGHQLGRVGLYLPCYAFAQRLAQVQLFPYPAQCLIVSTLASRLHRHRGLQRVLELHHLTRRHPAYRHFGHDTLQVSDTPQLVVDDLPELRLLETVVHHVEPLVDRPLVLERKHHPALQHTASHRGDGTVYHIQQRFAVFLHGLQQFQRAYREMVEPHIALFLDA